MEIGGRCERPAAGITSDGSGSDSTLSADLTTASGGEERSVGDFNNDGFDDISRLHGANGSW